MESNWFLGLFLLFMVGIMWNKGNNHFHWTNPANKNFTPIRSDGFGYYSFLPQYLLYADQPYFTYIDSLEKAGVKLTVTPGSLNNNAHLQHLTDKYFVGTAILYSPFFVGNTVYQKISGEKLDGYSYSYQLSAFIGALIYVFLSMLLLVKLFALFKLSRFSAYIGILILFLGTNLGYYSTVDFLMAHLSAFFACLLFLFFCKKWAVNHRNKDLFYSAAAFSLLLLIRPVDGIIILAVPFLFESFTQFRQEVGSLFTRKKRFTIPIILLISIGILSLQLFSNYYQSGHFFTYLYQDEGFSNIASPEIYNVLFSYKKGLFVYTPILFLLFPSWIILWIKEPYFGVGSFLVSFVFLWIVASWWQWYYGGSFGMRVFIDFYPLFILVIMKAVAHISTPWKVIYYGIIIIGIYVGQIFEFQYNHSIFHYTDMNKQRYWHVFLKTAPRFNWYPYRQIELQPYREQSKPEKSISFTYNSTTKKWQVGSQNTNESRIEDEKILRFKTPLDTSYLIGLRIDGQERIQSIWDQNNAVIVYKKGQTTSDSISLPIGPKIRDLHQFEPFHLEYINSKNAKADSLFITFYPFDAPRTIKDIKIHLDFFSR